MPPPVFLSTLGTLAQPSGTSQLREYLQSTRRPIPEEKLRELQTFLNAELASAPHLAKTRIRVGPTGMGGGAYLPSKDAISVDAPTVPILGHEIGHAKSMTSAGAAYKTLQNISRRLWKINVYGALPAAMAISALVKPGAAQQKAFKALTAASIGISAPTLLEEVSASADAMKYAPDKAEALRHMLPGLGSYVAMAAVPPVIYQLANNLSKRLV